MNQMDSRNMSSVIIRKTWGADDYFICGSPLPITSRGIWSGDNPLNCIFPVFILQAIAGNIVSRVVYMILKPMRQSKFLCSVLVCLHACFLEFLLLTQSISTRLMQPLKITSLCAWKLCTRFVKMAIKLFVLSCTCHILLAFGLAPLYVMLLAGDQFFVFYRLP